MVWRFINIQGQIVNAQEFVVFISYYFWRNMLLYLPWLHTSSLRMIYIYIYYIYYILYILYILYIIYKQVNSLKLLPVDKKANSTNRLRMVGMVQNKQHNLTLIFGLQIREGK